MAERATAVANRGVLAALRAAAVVIIATGLNDIVSSAEPRFEPLYVYLAAIALVVWLDGIIAGTLAAAAAIAFYALLFMEPRGLPIIPAGLALTVVLVVGIVRGFVRGRRRAEVVPEYVAPPPPLLPPPPPVVAADNSDVLQAIDDLRGELREREATLERNYVQAREALTSRVQVAEEESARLMTALAAARDEAASLAGRIAELELALNESKTALSASRTELDGFRRAIETEKQHAIALSGEVERSRTLRERLEQDLHARDGEATRLRLRIAELEQGLAESSSSARGEADELRRALGSRIAELEQSSRALEAERARATGEHTKREEALRGAEGLRARIAELEKGLAEGSTVARNESEELRRALETREAEAAVLRARIGEAEKGLAERVAAARSESEKLRRALEIRDADGAGLRTRMAELEQSSRRALEGERARADGEHAKREEALRDAAALRTRIADLEQGLAEGAAAARSEVDELRRTIEMERGRADDAIAERERISEEFDQKLQTIVSHLAADHETDLGKAVEEREAARAEARSLNMRMSALQRKVDEEREDSTRLLAETRTAAQKEIDALRARIAQLEAVPPPPPQPARPRVLIAHPDADLRMSARASLERAGYEIVGAADGLEALRTAIAQRPDVVIADAVMPKMDGRELCQLLKSQEKTAHIRVILLTRATDDPPKGDLPPDEILRKPVPLETLKATLASLLG